MLQGEVKAEAEKFQVSGEAQFAETTAKSFLVLLEDRAGSLQHSYAQGMRQLTVRCSEETLNTLAPP